VTATPPNTPIPGVFCKADLNKDGFVDLSDYSLIIKDFFKSTSEGAQADISGDGFVDLSDYSLLVADFFKNTTAGCSI
jgi:hypothetical protein